MLKRGLLARINPKLPCIFNQKDVTVRKIHKMDFGVPICSLKNEKGL